MAHNTPYWPWCAQAGAARSANLSVDQTNYGDGYNHRAVRGLNPVRPSWTLQFPFVGTDDITEMYAFLKANACNGFWFTPPDDINDAFVTVDTWSATISDKNKTHGIVGLLNVTFAQSFNPQMLNPTP